MLFSLISDHWWKYATCVLCFLMCVCAHSGPLVTQEVVDTRYLQLPAIQVDGVHYPVVEGQYAVDGELELVRLEEILCNEENGSYLNIHIRGLAVLFRIRDRRSQANLYQTRYVLDKVKPYQKAACRPNRGVLAQFEQQKTAWRQQQAAQFLTDVNVKIKTFLETQLAPSYKKLSFKIYYIADGGERFTNFNAAFDQLRQAMDLNQELGITVDALKMFSKAGIVFERALERHTVLGSEFDHQYKRVLHQNLAVTYLLSGKFTKARQHDAYALSSGMSQNDSLQSVILDRQKRAILSPKTARNPVALANLYRIGRNVTRYIEPKEMRLENY